jgi:hypothetical protein
MGQKAIKKQRKLVRKLAPLYPTIFQYFSGDLDKIEQYHFMISDILDFNPNYPLEKLSPYFIFKDDDSFHIISN